MVDLKFLAIIDKTRSLLDDITKEDKSKAKVSEAKVSMPPGKRVDMLELNSLESVSQGRCGDRTRTG